MKLMLQFRGMLYEFLPPYSPVFNPIEEAFSAIKAYLHHIKDDVLIAMSSRDDGYVYFYITEAVYSVSTSNAAGWFKHASYI